MKVSVRADKLPSIGIQKTANKLVKDRLTEVTLMKLKEAGLANSVYSKGLDFTDPSAASASVSHLFKLLTKYIEICIPSTTYLKTPLTEIGTYAGSTSLDIVLVLKERNALYNNLKFERSLGSGNMSSNREILNYGGPPWVTRYIMMLNQKIIQHRLPLAITASVLHHVLDDNEYFYDKPVDETKGRQAFVKIAIRVELTGWKSHTKKYPGLKFNKRTDCRKYGEVMTTLTSQFVYFNTLVKNESIPDEILINNSPYSLVFFLDSMIQVLKTLLRKSEYVPTVYSVRPRKPE